MANIGGERPLRVCDLCGAVDDHPRHILAGAGPDGFPRVSDEIVDRVLAAAPEDQRGRLLRELLDQSTSDRHKDCCRDAGCPTSQCDTELVGADGLTGADLLDHLVAYAQKEG